MVKQPQRVRRQAWRLRHPELVTNGPPRRLGVLEILHDEERAFRQVERALAARPQRLGHGVAVRGTRLQGGEEQEFEVPLECLGVQASPCYTSCGDVSNAGQADGGFPRNFDGKRRLKPRQAESQTNRLGQATHHQAASGGRQLDGGLFHRP
jgi:hypothetical protein